MMWPSHLDSPCSYCLGMALRSPEGTKSLQGREWDLFPPAGLQVQTALLLGPHAEATVPLPQGRKSQSHVPGPNRTAQLHRLRMGRRTPRQVLARPLRRIGGVPRPARHDADSPGVQGAPPAAHVGEFAKEAAQDLSGGRADEADRGADPAVGGGGVGDQDSIVDHVDGSFCEWTSGGPMFHAFYILMLMSFSTS